MKVFWVMAGDNYYPGYDNFLASFETRDEAEYFIYASKESSEYVYDWYIIVDISNRI